MDRLSNAPPARCDVLVIGAGASGLWAASRLARAGVDTLVLDEARSLGSGAFALGPGLALGWRHDHRHRLVQALGAGPAEELEHTIEHNHQLATGALSEHGWRACGGVLLPGDEREAAEIEAAPGRGERSQAALIEPDRVLGRLVSELEEEGGRLVLGAPVLALEDDNGSPRARLGTHSVSAELVLICAGAGGTQLDPSLGSFLVPQQHLALEVRGPETDSVTAPWCAWYGRLCGRPVPGGTHLVAGGRLEPGSRGDFPLRIERAMLASLAALMGWSPRELAVERRWTRHVAHTRDGLPLVGPVPGRVRRILCTGFNDHDADLAFACAEAVCSGVLTGRSELPGLLSARRLLGA